jgi:hypothetical protein
VLAPYLAVLLTNPVLLQDAAIGAPHCGVVYHLQDGSADRILASYFHGRFVQDTLATLPLHRQLAGRSSSGRTVKVVLDSLNTSDEPFPNQYHARVITVRGLDTTETVLFCDPPLAISIQSTRPGALDLTAAREIRSRIRSLHDSALAYDPEVLKHDTLDFQTPGVLQPTAAPELRIVTYRITLRLKREPNATGDQRASGFAIYSTATHRVLYATFGHPEWDPSAETVAAVYPRLVFSVAGDQHLYLLAVFDGPWESAGGQWVVFDAKSGAPMTAPELRTGGRFP